MKGHAGMVKNRKTCRRYNEPGHAHALTFTCFHGQAFLSKDRSRLWTIDAIDKAREKHRFHLWAYVIMPEHVHLLIWPTTPGYSISAILKSIKQSVARSAITYVQQYAPDFLHRMEDRQPNGSVTHRFWQRDGGYDRNLTEPTTIWSTIDYIHANPVRRGLCLRPDEWEWSSAREWQQAGAGHVRLNRDSVPRTKSG
jgi:putative transposase